MRKFTAPVIALTVALTGAVMTSPLAFAHVVVRPSEVVTAGYQTFSAGVPNEKDVAMTELRIVMPSGLKSVSPSVKPGWTINTEKTGSGESTNITSITWTNGAIDSGLRDDFTFSAQVPEKTTSLEWKAYQTFADGSMVSWDKSGDTESDTSGPFSVTKVVTKTESDEASEAAIQAANNAAASADSALYVAIAAIVVGIGGVYVGLRKK
jgi:uncharacterized protein YcnI